MQLRYFSIKIVTMAIAFLCISYRLAASDWFTKGQSLLEKAQSNETLQSAVKQGSGLLKPKATEPVKELETIELEKRPVIELIEPENPERIVKEEPLVEVIEPVSALESVVGLAETGKGLYKKAQEVIAPTRTAAEKESAQRVETQKIDYKIQAKEKAKNPSWLKYLNK